MKNKWTAKKVAGGFYLGFLVLWLLGNVAAFAFDRLVPAAYFAPEQGEAVFMQQQPDGSYITENTDPQLIFNAIGQNVRRVILQAEFETHPGEMAMYYTRKESAGFSPKKRIWGDLRPDGSYEYILPPGNVEALRIDPGTQSNNHITITGVHLNPRQPFAQYFGVSFATLMAFLTLPALAVCVFYTVLEALCFIKKAKGKP